MTSASLWVACSDPLRHRNDRPTPQPFFGQGALGSTDPLSSHARAYVLHTGGVDEYRNEGHL